MDSVVVLKACPFCGGDAISHGYGFTGEHYGIVDCSDCGGAVQVMPGSEADAIARWNTRLASAALQPAAPAERGEG